MKLFLDSEFNGFGGSLIAIALVSENENDPYFYKKFDLPEGESYHSWVEDNVLPKLDAYEEGIYSDLQEYLTYIADSNNENILEIVSDWPEDIVHICKLMMPSPGYMINTMGIKVTFELDKEMCSGPYRPMHPHNALSDAMTNCVNYMRHFSSDEEE